MELQQKEEKNILEIIEAINQISLHHPDLMGIATDYSGIYFKNSKKEEDLFDKFWGNGDFVNQSVLAVKESIVLAMSALTLKPNIKFDMIYQECLSFDKEKRVLEKVLDRVVNSFDTVDRRQEALVLNDFIKSLRLEIFMRIFSQNKEMQKTTKIPKEELSERQSLYVHYINMNYNK